MNHEKFVALATEMRQAQKCFKRTLNDSDLEKMERLEKAVDAALIELAEGQKRLFG